MLPHTQSLQGARLTVAVPCTARDFHSLDRALERHAEWKAELRRLHLADELLALPPVVGALRQEVRELAAGQARLTEEVRALASTQSLPTRPLARACSSGRSARRCFRWSRGTADG